MQNREFKHTRQKLIDDPDYEFHSEWHKERHFQAERDMEDDIRLENIAGIVASVVVIMGMCAMVFG